ncbi:hypothetical protein R5R35_000469 [Gryllus longicercus]|uniref:CULT domain-containing protein n=1 Tax=Gryllus longicercus TaxID=2509291 RepID=A0AAN9VUL6_9ORTH|nr:Uncharacterized protein GBIM_06330 [Gryllus bimaculatus]
MRRAHSAFWPPPSLLLSLVIAVVISTTVSSPLSGECVLCRQCGADVSDGVHIVNQFSPSALVRGNQSLFGARDVQVQVLENPLGVRFRVVTFTKASCGPGHTWHNEHSWFPGYIWRHCLCPRCGHHLGWIFIPQSMVSLKTLYALSLDNILGEQFSDSLMVVPKAYQS